MSDQKVSEMDAAPEPLAADDLLYISRYVSPGVYKSENVTVGGAIPASAIQNIANNTLLGNNSGVSGPPTEIDASEGRTLLGLGTIATQNASNVAITGGSVSGATLGSGATLTAGSTPLTAIASIANNTLLGNSSGSSASPSALDLDDVEEAMGGPFLPLTGGTLSGRLFTTYNGSVSGGIGAYNFQSGAESTAVGLYCKSNSSTSSIVPCIRLDASTEYDRPWIVWRDKDNLSTAAMGFHYRNSNDEELHDAYEIKTVASDGADMVTRFTVGAHQDIATCSFNAVNELQINAQDYSTTDPVEIVWRMNNSIGTNVIILNESLRNDASDNLTYSISPTPFGATDSATIRLFRETNTSGTKSFQIQKGDNTNTVQLSMEAGTGEFFFADQSAAASASGRVRRNDSNLSWHNGTSANNLVYDTYNPTFPSLSVSGARSLSAWGTNGAGIKTVASIFTDTSSSGAVAGVTAIHEFAAPTLAASSASTYAIVANVHINGGVNAGTNATITLNRALLVENGQSVFTGGVQATGSVVVNQNSGTNTTSIGTGSTSGAVTIGGGSNQITLGSTATLRAGTATAGTAPLVFTSGTNLTTAVAGTMEYNGTNLFFTRSGTTREGVLTQSAVTAETVTADTTITVNVGGLVYKLVAVAVP